MKSKVLAIFMMIFVAAIAFPAAAGADAAEPNTRTWEDPNGSGLTVSITTPLTYANCADETTFDTISTNGLPDDWWVGAYFHVQAITDSGRQSIQEYRFNFDGLQKGDQVFEISYPPISEWPVQGNGTAEVHVDLAIRVIDENGNNVPWIKSDPNIDGLVGPYMDWDVFCLTPPPPPPPPPPDGGGQGCTPGFWKNNADKKGADQWVNYNPEDMFDEVFGVNYEKTLLDALQTGGGNEKALGRHAAAALLNAASSDVDYLYSESEIIQLVQDAFNSGDYNAAKNLLVAQNEAGCPLDNNGKSDEESSQESSEKKKGKK